MQHISVLTDEILAALALAPDGVFVDATLGSGGHTRAVAQQLGSNGHIIANDVDPVAINSAKAWQDDYQASITLSNHNFADIDSWLPELYSERAPDAILADLGWRSEQFTNGGRGFSFMADEPLQMTFGDPANYGLQAADIVNEWAESDITNVLRGYGEEPYARRIARAIIEARGDTPIKTARELATIVYDAVPKRVQHARTHPATRTFQALRITVNDELTVLDTFITKAFGLLSGTGRLAIISFHSLEDRIVKHRFRELANTGLGALLVKRPITPSVAERSSNPRARSAKLRTIMKL